MKHSAQFRRCLEDCDVAGVRTLWKHVSPHLPQPRNDNEALVILHHARTQSVSIPFKLRAYSHRWLSDNGFPSGLPDNLKPRAERIYPKIVAGVGVSMNASSDLMVAILPIVHRSVNNAIEEAFADGRTEPGFVSTRMRAAREATVRQLIGKIS